MKTTDVRVTGAALWFLPIETRMPLKFGAETVTRVTCARVAVRVEGRDGTSAVGWGETPLSVTWVWPSTRPYGERLEALRLFTELLASAWANYSEWGHPMELGAGFNESVLPRLLEDFNASVQGRLTQEGGKDCEMPWLAALVCESAYDLAVHDAYGRLLGLPTYHTYNRDYMTRDLADFFGSELDGGGDLGQRGQFPDRFLLAARREQLPAWHLVGGVDPLEVGDLKGDEPKDGYPVLLGDWIRRDGLTCLKIKLRGTDAAWDYDRMVRVAKIGLPLGVQDLTADFNCTVRDPAYVCEILDRLQREHREVWDRLLYVEQPFPYELEAHRIDVREVSRRKPLFLDESAHDWRHVRLGLELGWNGVALKTCKTQTGAILSACWAQAHGMQLMVQDLTNPMLAQIPHCLLAAWLPTLRGVETNAMQFYPEASALEARVHPGLYTRRGGQVDLRTVSGAGFGYRLEEVGRELGGAGFTAGRID